MLDHLAAPAVHRRVDQHVRAGRHEQVRAGRDVGRVDQVALDVEHRALFEAGAHLVHADHAHVRAGVHRPGGQVLVEGQVGTPGLVHDQRLAPLVADLGDRADVRARPVRRRADDQGAGCVRVAPPGVLDGLRRRGMARCSSRSQRGGTQRGCTPEKIRPATTDLCASRPTSSSPLPPATASIAALTDRELPQVEKKAWSAPTASAISSSASLQVPVGGGPVIQSRAGQHVRPEGLRPEHRRHPRVHAYPLPVTRRREAVPAQLVVVSQRFDQRCLIVVHADCSTHRRPDPTFRAARTHHPRSPSQRSSRHAWRTVPPRRRCRRCDRRGAVGGVLLPELMAPARLHRRGGSSRQSSWLPGTGPGAGPELTSSTS